ncbi:(d)CMP kinase [Halocynthiibacter sp. C4]|uniref:(d)CMP kinase n=1 Tax=Halocynthiibacter sp. C4 TaxID=2992758 RepID=UPI00237AFE39|nr:(d)CMP kinase [Halocynthiibacter sp. C4]MDE0588656.1 (d)CMP kinase [Halocynthiibacter sp. C4]
MQFTVAIDGPAAAGKGTVSKAVATHFGFAYLDTGLLYRAVGARVLDGADAIEAAQSLNAKEIDGSQLRTAEVAEAASKAAAMPEVRAALIEFQRGFAKRQGGAVLDGRDIGTVICPDASVKLFVTASAEVRATRRFLELSEKDSSVDFEQVLADVKARDERDASRDAAPLVAADDAVVIDTSELTIKEAVSAAVSAIEAKLVS